MKKLLLISLTLICTIHLNAQEYDVGVFYMPFWHNVHAQDQGTTYYPGYFHTGPSDPNYQMLQNHHWKIIGDYDAYLVNKYLFNEVRIPKGIWYAGNINNINTLSPSYWYNESIVQITERQLELMADYEIDFVIYDWYWNYCECGNPNYLTDPLDLTRWRAFWDIPAQNWLTSGFDNHGMQMAIYWADQFNKLVFYDSSQGYGGNPDGADGFFGTGQGLELMLDEVAQYMNMSGNRYKTKNGENLFYIYYPALYDFMESISLANHPFFSGINGTSESHIIQRIEKLLDHMDDRLYVKTGKHTYFVADVREPVDWGTRFTLSTRKEWMIDNPIEAGFDALTSYRYSYYEWSDMLDGETSGTDPWEPRFNDSYDYNTMTDVYEKNYNFHLANIPGSSNVEYQVPITEGWNKAPMWMNKANNGDASVYIDSHLKTKNLSSLQANDYKRYIYDNANSTPSQYLQALQNAKSFIDQNPTLTDRTAILCCWNEHAEGTGIEPTEVWDYQYLEKIEDVFKTTLLPPGGGIQELNNNSLIVNNKEEIPEQFTFESSFPNPTNKQTKLKFEIPEKGNVKLEVMNSGQNYASTILDEEKEAGKHSVEHNITSLPSGLYLYRLTYKGRQIIRKVIVNK